MVSSVDAPQHGRLQARPVTVGADRYLLCAFVAAAAVLLNEYVYYQSAASAIVNLVIFFSGLFVLVWQPRMTYLFVVFCGYLLNTRPRELHILDIDVRGNFEYFSFNMQKLGGVTGGTLYLLTITLVALLTVMIYRQRLTISWRAGALIALLAITTLSTLLFIAIGDGTVGDLGRATPVVRFYLLMLGGFFLPVYLGMRGIMVSEQYLLFRDAMLWAVLMGAVAAVLHAGLDVYSGSYKLQFVTSVLFFGPALFITLSRDFLSIAEKTILALLSCIVFVPLTRGEQLIFGLDLMIFVLIALLVYLTTQHRRQVIQLASSAVVMFAAVGVGVLLFWRFFPSSFAYLAQKALFFIEGDLLIDKSSIVRVEELGATFDIRASADIYWIAFGKGFAGWFELPAGFSGYLNLADFSDFEISNNQFYSPHSFISYMTLKSGIVGLLIYLSFVLSPLRRVFQLRKITPPMLLLFFFLPSFLLAGYFDPYLALLSGVIVRLAEA